MKMKYLDSFNPYLPFLLENVNRLHSSQMSPMYVFRFHLKNELSKNIDYIMEYRKTYISDTWILTMFAQSSGEKSNENIVFLSIVATAIYSHMVYLIFNDIKQVWDTLEIFTKNSSMSVSI
jgi:hypothetical protein